MVVGDYSREEARFLPCPPLLVALVKVVHGGFGVVFVF